jgi:hypothetical protein
MNVGDLVMVTLRGASGRDKQKPGLILQFDGWDDGMPQNILVLTGPKQLWVESRQVRPFPAASMAQSRRVARRLENMVINAKRVQNDDSE